MKLCLENKINDVIFFKFSENESVAGNSHYDAWLLWVDPLQAVRFEK